MGRRKAPSLARRQTRGFTLVELLVYATIASVVLAAAANTVLSSIRSSSNLEVERRGIEIMARISQFIEAEANEGTEIISGTDPQNQGYADCHDSEDRKRSVSPQEILFSIVVQPKSNTILSNSNPTVYQPASGRVLVHYALRLESGFLSLLRCGPPYDPITGDLKLDADKAYETMIHPRAQVVLDPLKTSKNRVTYNINFLTPPGPGQPATPIFNTPRRATATTGQQLID